MTTRKEPPPSREEVSIYVGDLDKTVSKHDLFTKFNAKGVVQDIVLPLNNGISLGYAYINYKTPIDAQRALIEFGCITEINCKQCRVMKYCKENKNGNNNNNIFIKNLSISIDNKSLNDLFSKYGKVLSAKVARDRETDKSLCYGYVSFQKEESAINAVSKTNNMMVCGQQIITEIFISKKERQENISFTNVYCKYIPPSWTEQEILALFNKYGKITNYNINHLPIGTSACINFEKSKEAKVAIIKLNGLQCDDNNILYVARAQKQKERKFELEREERKKRKKRNIESKDWKLYISNLSYYVNNEDLMRIFIKYGTITTAFIVYDKNSGNSTGRGFVGFLNKENAERAQYEMNGFIYYGRKIYVQKARDNRNYNRNRQQRTAYIPKISQCKHNDNKNKEENNDQYIENEVSVWLKKKVKLPEYIELFKNEGVEDMETVQLLKEEDLNEIGIKKFGHKKKIIQYILQLNQEKKGGD